MKVRTPHYYKDFKCIAGACTDTCCAGWEVDVDPKAYKYYKTVKGEFGKRLKSVMVPDGEGGCNFTLQKGRCPFLNQENLCDLYIALGEDKLCDTCAEFPRFINEYGSVKEMGIAPSCITAGELIFNYDKELTFDEEEDGKPLSGYNDIDAFLFMQLSRARKLAYAIIQDKSYTIEEVCLILLCMAEKIQKHMDNEQDYLIENVVKAFSDKTYVENVLKKEKARQEKLFSEGKDLAGIKDFFKEFKGMEVINKDWFKYLEINKRFLEEAKGRQQIIKHYRDFDAFFKGREFEYRQILMYYTFRYFLDAVYDINILLKVKIGIVGFLVLKQLDVAVFTENGGAFSKAEQVDIAHLYSRQFEHSYSNYEAYCEFFMSKRCYSKNALKYFLTYL